MKTFGQAAKSLILLSFTTVAFSQFSSAQEQFRLSDYKNPDYKWKQLDLRFGLGGTNSFIKQEIENGIDVKGNTNTLQSGIGADYYATKNSKFYQGYQDFSVSGDFVGSSYSYTNLKDNLGNDQKSNYQRILLGGQTVNRFYNNKKRFVEIDLELDAGLYNSIHKFSADEEFLPYRDKSTDYTNFVTASLPLLIGTGRIEEVQDARLAVYILDDLTNAGDLKRTPTPDEILAFSRFITQTKNQRFFDSRIRKIAEITAIDSILTVLDLKAQSDASYFTLINDNWDNGNGPVRKTGGRFSIGLMPAVDLSYNESQDFFRDTINNPDIIESYSHKNTTHNDSWNLDAIAGYEWQKPANLYWQHTVNTGIAYSLYYEQENSKVFDMDTLTSEQKRRLNTPNLKIDLGYTIGYYPNSRTSIKLGIETSLEQYWGNEKVNDDPETDAGRTLLNNDLYLSCYYYISPQVRLSVNINSAYLFSKTNQPLPDEEYGYRTSHDLHNSVSASLTYSIF